MTDDITRKLIEAAEAVIPCDPNDGTLPVFFDCACVDESESRIAHWTPVERVARAAVTAVLRELAHALGDEAYEMATAGEESPRSDDYREGHYVGWMRAVDKVARRYTALADEIERQP
ncbi:hypothetical protein [Amycolatopsis kentuckyensis]|uniref:hypothetical protein n=1 Tax=Amycolatopsis kentuckyensis TaxID=218823 RepID=UPI000A3BE326|nr:hypothetical protein [Amycolatopsis kentuckyensis]